MSRTLSLTAADGHVFSAYAAGEPSADAAVVILQEIFGVNAHIRSVADTYARHGFYAVAPALFDRVERDAELPYTPEGLERGRALAGHLAPEVVLRDIAAALAHGREVVKTGRVGVVGYCLGGSYAWLSATRLNTDAAVGYYGSKVAAHLDEKPRAPVIFHFGDKDRGIPLTDVEKIRAAHPAVPVHVYDAGHGFNRDGSAAYNEAAASLAFSRSLSFLQHTLAAHDSAACI
jgi:carboxymethylenebutenolidase